jgi:hypothetical protein
MIVIRGCISPVRPEMVSHSSPEDVALAHDHTIVGSIPYSRIIKAILSMIKG